MDFASVDHALHTAVEQGVFPGAVVLVKHAGTVCYRKAVGYRSIEPERTPLSEETMASMIARAVHVVVQVARMADGRRRITAIGEVIGHRCGEIPIHPVFELERTGTGPDGAIHGRHLQVASSMMTDRFRAAGVLPSPRRSVAGGGVESGAAAASGEIG